MNLLTIILIGRSGCGKGTQADKLLDYIKENDKREILHLEAGGRFRSFIKDGTYASNLANQVNEEGGLQPEFLAIWAWGGEIIKRLKPNQHLLIDGTPRRLGEAKILDSAIDFFDREKVHVVYLNVSQEWAIKKLVKRGRSDDKDMSDIIARMNWFKKEVSPVLDYYRAHKKHYFHDVNGEQTVEDVHKDILKSIGL